MIKSKNLAVSIVIPAFNEEKYLGQCLESIVKLDTSLKFEVIVVDNNCTDQTVKIAQSFQDRLKIRIIKETKQGRGAARARGFAEAKGSIIASTDADTIVYPDWLDILVGALSDQVIAATTPGKITDCSPLTNLVFNFIQPAMATLYGSIFGNCWLFGFSFAILKSVYQQSGGFNANLQAQEDFELGYRVCKLGQIKLINKPVLFSGRRFKNGLISAFYEYIKTFVVVIIFKRKEAYLDNPR